jgi:hypothetical protein
MRWDLIDKECGSWFHVALMDVDGVSKGHGGTVVSRREGEGMGRIEMAF